MPTDNTPADFSDSDQAWFDRLSATAPSGPPQSAAEREAELLRRARARRAARAAAAEAAAEAAGDTAQDASADAVARNAAQEARWQRLRARLHTDAPSPEQTQPDPAEPRPPLQPTAAQPLAPRWRHRRWQWAGGGALAAAVLVAVVVVQRPDEPARIYDDLPELGQRGDTTVQRRQVEQPRQAAEALHRALQQAGEPATLHQHGRVFIVLLQVSSETTPAARAALAAAGVQAPAGPLRIEFEPR